MLAASKSLTICLLAALGGVLLAVPGPAFADELGCGDVITEDTVLSADLLCTDTDPYAPGPDSEWLRPAVAIGADNVTLALNGHSLTSYAGDAVVAYGQRRITIKNGAASGIRLTDSTDSRVRYVQFSGSFGSGIALIGGGRNRIQHNTGRGEAGIGLQQSANNVVTDNDIGAPAGALVVYQSARNRIEHNSLCAGMGGPLYTSDADNNLFKANLVPSKLPGIDEPHCYGLSGSGFVIGPASTGNRLIANDVSGVKFAPADLGLDDPGGDGIEIQSPGNYLAANSANQNDRYGISAVPRNQSGINYAQGNGNPAQCLNVICRPGPARTVPAGPRPTRPHGDH
jgi:parallel beta-helix repeat protein